jgi:hypothetical protein
VSELRSDLAALLVDLEEQIRLDAELSIDVARVDVEFGEGARAVRARQLLAEFEALESLATEFRWLVRNKHHQKFAKVHWDAMTAALARYDAAKEKK